jgi:hypothetical protein
VTLADADDLLEAIEKVRPVDHEFPVVRER